MIKRYISSYSIINVLALPFVRGVPDDFKEGFPTSAKHVFPTRSATDGLIIALKALAGGRGKVAVSAYTCIKVPDALKSAGFEPAFIDINRDSGMLESSALNSFVPGDLVAIIATHLFGATCDMDGYQEQAKRLNVLLIEDCAMAQGSVYHSKLVGSFAPVAIFSFGRGKNINFGGGGGLLINDIEMRSRVARYISGFQKNASFLDDCSDNIKTVAKMMLLSVELWNIYFEIVIRLKRLRTGTWFWEENTKSATLNFESGRVCRFDNLYFKLLSIIDVRRDFKHRRLVSSIYENNIMSGKLVRHLVGASSGVSYVRPSYPLIVDERKKELFQFLRSRGVDCGLSFGYSAANVVRVVGALPVLADCASELDWNMSAETIAQKITSKTKAVIVVHYAGFPCDMAPIVKLCQERGIKLIEDAAHAPGASIDGQMCGTFGDVGCFSFFSNKNLSIGEGGMVVACDEALSQRLRFLRSHGMTTLTLDRHKGRAISYDVAEAGLNYRMDEMRAAIGLVQLDKLPAGNQRRKVLTDRYRQNLAESAVLMPFSELPLGVVPAFHILPVLLPVGVDRPAVIEALKVRGVQSSIHYPPFWGFTAYKGFFKPEDAPLTAEICARELTLPLYPGMTDADVDYVTDALLAAVK